MSKTPWYVEAFRSDYREVYAHRNLASARSEIRWLVEDVLAGVQGRILDDCCGFGRHTLALRERGLDVFGIDLSLDLLRSAPSLSADAGEVLAGRLAQSDMRALPFADSSFHGLLNLFTSFGYLGEEGDSAALSEMTRVLAPEGVLVMDLMNPTAIRRGLVPESREERDGIVLAATRSLEDDGARVVKTVEVTFPSGETRRWTEDVRMFEPTDIDALLGALGFATRYRAGDFTGRPYDAETAERQIVVAARVHS